MSFAVAATHSRWGPVNLDAVEEDDEYHFKYPNGKLMGTMARDANGTLQHPNHHVADFMRFYGIELVKHDFAGYQELRSIMVVAIKQRDPVFFYHSVHAVRYVAPPVEQMVTATMNLKRFSFVMEKLPNGAWHMAGHGSSDNHIAGELDAVMKQEPFSGEFQQLWIFHHALAAAGFTNIR